MSILFTPEARAKTLDTLLTLFKADEQVSGVISFGSETREFADNYAGIDLLIVSSAATTAAAAYIKHKASITKELKVLFQTEKTDPHPHLSLLLDTYLMVDIGVMSLVSLQPLPGPYKILVDKASAVSDMLKKQKEVPDDSAGKATYLAIIEPAWQLIMQCVQALNRDDVWRALYLLGALRKDLIQLAGMHHGVDTTDYLNLDELPEMLVIQLRHTLPMSTSQTGIRRALRKATSMLFDEAAALDSKFDVKTGTELEKKLAVYLDSFG